MITHCICFNKSFKEIIDLAKENDLKYLHQIQRKFDICNKCHMCNPYIKQALVTGETKFPVPQKKK
jgi:NAD(P)H-nitrite reductase large subunit